MPGDREARRKYAQSYNKTMLAMWREKILLDKRTRAFKTGSLYKSADELRTAQVNSEATIMTFSYKYALYGLYVEQGVGRGYFHGNHGDIGAHRKPRRKRPWMNPKYFMSLMNIREFMAENLALEAVHIVEMIGQSVGVNAHGGSGVTRSGRYINNSAVPGANLPS